MTPYERFKNEGQAEAAAAAADPALSAASAEWFRRANAHKYSYHFEWLGRPIIQYPQDMVAMQELIWRVQPEVIVETGIAHGGSLIFSASMLELNATCGGAAGARVIGVDIDIRAHNREAIEAHPLARRIRMIQGSSIDPGVVAQVRAEVGAAQRVLVCLDSNHTHEHVLAELEAYAGLVSAGSYCVVFDTVIEHMPAEAFADRPWRPGNSPLSAVRQWLPRNPQFEVDRSIDERLLVSVAPEGYLRRLRA